MGFFPWERDKFKAYFRHNEGRSKNSPNFEKNRNDFVIFVDEHDRRPGTNFLKTFPKWKMNITPCIQILE